jgi:hypothetical protein
VPHDNLTFLKLGVIGIVVDPGQRIIEDGARLDERNAMPLEVARGFVTTG